MFYGDRRRFFKKEARAFLRENYIATILCSFVALAVIAGVFLVETLFISLFASYVDETVVSVIFLAAEIAAFLFLCPLIFGWCTWFLQSMRQRAFVPLHSIFHPYSSFSGIVRATRVTVLYFLIALAVSGAVLLAVYTGGKIPSLLMESPFYALLSFACEIIFTILAFAAIFLSIGALCVLNLSTRNDFTCISQSLKESRSIMKGHKIEFFILLLSFLPLVILSVFSFGILFVVYTIPYIALTVSAFTDYVCAEYDVMVKE